jgi:hypothetical protein
MSKHHGVLLVLVLLVSLSFSSSKSLSAAQVPVARTINLGAVNPATATIGNTNKTITLSVTIVSSADVPAGVVTAKIDFLEVSNFQNIGYSVNPSNRTKNVILNGGGAATTVSFDLTTGSGNSVNTAGNIVSQFRLDSVSGGGLPPTTIIDPRLLSIGVEVTAQNSEEEEPPPPGCPNPTYPPPSTNCSWDTISCNWVGCDDTPIIIDVNNDGYKLTDATNGVRFDIDGDGLEELVSWTAEGSDDAFLFLDRNEDGVVNNGGELFGNHTNQLPSPHANGFLALAEYDKRFYGGNGDRVIASSDSAHSKLRLWRDDNHNGICEPAEVFTLEEFGIKSIDVRYQDSKKKDEFGNEFRYRARIYDEKNTSDRWCWDVFLRRQR